MHALTDTPSQALADLRHWQLATLLLLAFIAVPALALAGVGLNLLT